MTLKQLLAETAALGFDESRELDDSFVFAANRALRLISSEHASEKEGDFFVPELDVSFYKEEIKLKNTEEISFSASGKAYSFRGFGSGTLFVKDGEISRAIPFELKGGTHSGFIDHGNAEFTIYPSGRLTIFDFAVFSSLDEKEDIPICRRMRTFDLKEQISDFSYATAPPKDSGGKIIEGISILGERIDVPRDFSGEIKIRYKPIPIELSGDFPDMQIDLPQRCLHLCPILTAAYKWLDDDAEKAAYYMQIYREESQKLRLFQSKDTDLSYKDVTGWVG